MALPLILLAGMVAGPLTTKGVVALRKWWNEGEEIGIECRRCNNNGPHKFVTIDRSIGGTIFIGALTGTIGGSVSGAVAKRVFQCESCGCSMYENGERPDWNMDKALESFVRYPALKEAYEDAQGLIARNQKIAIKHKTKISLLEKQLKDTSSDKVALERELKAISEAIRREAA
jgi:hypothetical protein